MLYHIVWKLVLEQQKSERAGRTALQSQLMGGDAAGPGFLALGREVDDDASQRLLELTKSLGLLQAQVGEMLLMRVIVIVTIFITIMININIIIIIITTLLSSS